ncbi:hypothetical protein GCM10023340_12640 [Nocardioides marinquilinus]|uniref:ARB-07466-like C-terminal domain-containing protein n=1 Tax=Nocardioides marinquilinus TaxID=1210400 RepID=A0ABP9PD48_9ACTN
MAGAPIEDYAAYQPATRCAPAAKPGTRTLLRFVVRTYGGRAGPVSRSCTRRTRVTSEHQEGRALDWMVDARTPQGRRAARALLDDLFATDPAGNEHARARRMGVMYVIWDDRMYAAWDAFRGEPYLSSSCPSRRRCSATLRHRDHVHVSLTRAAAQGRTSWFERRAGRG